MGKYILRNKIVFSEPIGRFFSHNVFNKDPNYDENDELDF